MLLAVQKDDGSQAISHWDSENWTELYLTNTSAGRGRYLGVWALEVGAGAVTWGDITGDAAESWASILLTLRPSSGKQLRIADLNQATPVEVADTSNPSSPSVNVATSDTLVLYYSLTTNGDTAGTHPSGTTRVTGSPSQGGTDNGTKVDIAYATEGAGATGTKQWTGGSAGQDSWNWTVAIVEALSSPGAGAYAGQAWQKAARSRIDADGGTSNGQEGALAIATMLGVANQGEVLANLREAGATASSIPAAVNQLLSTTYDYATERALRALAEEYST